MIICGFVTKSDENQHHEVSQCRRQSEHFQLLLDCGWSSSCIVTIIAMMMMMLQLHSDNHKNHKND